MLVNIFQKGFNFSQDGPGNRLVYHLQGCNMQCPWCSNPEGLDPKGNIMIAEGVSDTTCNQNAIIDGVFDSKICKGCLRMCLDTSHAGLKLSCQTFETDDVVDEAVRSRSMFFSKGGVTFTGGEPTLNLPVLLDMLKKLKQHNINIAIETNGSHPELTTIIPYVDYLIFDLKHYDDEKHRKTLGISNSIIRKNLRRCSFLTDISLRIPLIKGFNASEENAYGFVKELELCNKNNITVEFLKFHEYGKSKWTQCGMEYKMTGQEYIDQETLDMFVRIFNDNSIKTIIT